MKPQMRILARRGAPLMISLLTIPMLGVGCVGLPSDTQEGNVGVDPGAYPNQRVIGEPNDTFGEALDVIFDANGYAQLRGSIPRTSDVDVYALGPLSAGDRLFVDVGGSAGLDSSLAVFDEGGRIIFENDDRDPALNQLNPFMNDVLRVPSSVFFLAITSAPLGPSTGSYDVAVQVVRGGTAPAPLAQTVVLDFTGGTIDIPGEGTYRVGRFDTADIASVYTGMTAAVEQAITATVRENYEGLNLQVLVLPGDEVPAECTSFVYFGGRNPGAYGTSQAVDPYNADRCDDSIVFTEMFTPSRFGRVLSASELGRAIGNIATHEIGHLLGLNHVDNVFDIMDTTGGAETFLIDQEFLQSPLNDTIFPIGSQDGFLLLLLTIGAAS